MTPGPAPATLVLDAALDACLAAVVAEGTVLAQRRAEGLRASTSVLPALAAEVLAAAGLHATALCHIAVTTGPGSFTGVRAALALAHGIAMAAAIPVLGVTLGDAMRAASTTGRPIWVAIDSKRGRIFLDRGGVVENHALDALPRPPGAVALAGNAAIAVASRMAARGDDVQLLPLRAAPAWGIAAAAASHGVPSPLPLYVDPVAARPNLARQALPLPMQAGRHAGGVEASAGSADAPPLWPATLVHATLAHADALAAIHAAAFPRGAQWGAQAMGLQLGLPGAFGYIHPGGGMVLARTAADEAEILTLAVAPEARRQGLGRALLHQAMVQASRAGAATMVLEVGAQNLAAQALYAGAGFQPVGRRPRYYTGGEDALIMRGPLLSCG